MRLPARWRAWRATRRARAETRYREVRDIAMHVVERRTQALIERGAAALKRDEPDVIEVVPANPEAASVWLEAGPAYHSLCVGPHGNLHEVLLDRGHVWVGELEECLSAVFEGRYTEEITEDGRKLRMVFGRPGKEDLTVRHYAGTMPSDGTYPFGEPGRHFYAAY